jgi:hypothetical protein
MSDLASAQVGSSGILRSPHARIGHDRCLAPDPSQQDSAGSEHDERDRAVLAERGGDDERME